VHAIGPVVCTGGPGPEGLLLVERTASSATSSEPCEAGGWECGGSAVVLARSATAIAVPDSGGR
jgi:hypothetical protein